jgi:hypothetical protein
MWGSDEGGSQVVALGTRTGTVLQEGKRKTGFYWSGRQIDTRILIPGDIYLKMPQYNYL